MADQAISSVFVRARSWHASLSRQVGFGSWHVTPTDPVLQPSWKNLRLDRSTQSHRMVDFEMMSADALSNEDLRERIQAFGEPGSPGSRERDGCGQEEHE